MKAKIDLIDEKEKKMLETLKEDHAKKSGFSKLMPYNQPRYLIVFALIGSLIDGSIQPFFGFIFSKFMGLLGIPVEYFKLTEGEDYLQNEISKYALMMAIASVVNGFGAFSQKSSFGALGNTVTLQVRKILYGNVLEKHIGWFDERENSPSVLTSVIASDTALINGVSAESLGPQLEAMFALCTGLVLGFVFCW